MKLRTKNAAVTLLAVLCFLAFAQASFAADQAPRDEQTAGEEREEGRGDVIEDEGEGEGRGDVVDDKGGAATSIMDAFPIGMPREDALEAGAKASNSADALAHSGSWLDAEWRSTLMLEKGKLATLAMKTALDHRTLASVLQYLRENSYAVMNLTGVDGREISFVALKAQGKSDEALSETFDKALEAFADADKGSCMIALCLDDTLNELADVTRKKGDEDAVLKKEKDTVLYAIQLDKKDDSMLLLMSTFGAMGKD